MGEEEFYESDGERAALRSSRTEPDAAGCFSAAAASIDRVRIRLAAEELDEMGMPVLEAEAGQAYSVTGVERISGDPASGPAMDGQRWEKRK